MRKGWQCGNCGHIHPDSEDLATIGFQWFDQRTSKVSCGNCGSYTLQQVTDTDAEGVPTAGQFLLVTSHIKR